MVCVLHVKQEFKDIKIILLGDFNQLPPVENENRSYENSLMLKELSDFNRITLTKCVRGDDAVFKAGLQVLSDGEIPSTVSMRRKISQINLCFTNKMRKYINSVFMKKNQDKIHLKITDYIDEKIDEKSNLQNDHIAFDGEPVIAIINNKKENYYNSEKYTVKKIGPTEIILLGEPNEEGEQKEKVVNTEQFFKDFVPSYATTVHKAQGKTLRIPFTIFEWEKMRDKKMKYVAISRATKIENINIYPAV